MMQAQCHLPVFLLPVDTKESDGIADPLEKIAIKYHSDHSDSRIGKLTLDAKGEPMAPGQ